MLGTVRWANGVQFFPQPLLAAMQQHNLVEFDAACDLEATGLSKPRLFMFSLNQEPYASKEDNGASITTKLSLCCIETPTHQTIFLAMDLLTLVLLYASQNVAFLPILDHLLLRGLFGDTTSPRDPHCRLTTDCNSNWPLSVANAIDDLAKSVMNPINTQIWRERHAAIAAHLLDFRELFLLPELWDIVQSFFTPIILKRSNKRARTH